MPVEDEPLMRWQKQRAAAGQTWKGLVEFAAANPGYLDEVLDQVRQRPLAPAELVDPRPRDGAWWGDRSEGASRSTGCFGSARLGSVVVLGS